MTYETSQATYGPLSYVLNRTKHVVSLVTSWTKHSTSIW